MKRWIEKLIERKDEPAHLRSGRWGERKAVCHLKDLGYQILGKRVRVGQHDELDIVARQGSAYVFVEVKTRKNENFGRPFAAVDRPKRQRLARAAVAYLKKRRLEPENFRFDVIEIVGEPSRPEPEIRHIENAFPLDEQYRLWW